MTHPGGSDIERVIVALENDGDFDGAQAVRELYDSLSSGRRRWRLAVCPNCGLAKVLDDGEWHDCDSVHFLPDTCDGAGADPELVWATEIAPEPCSTCKGTGRQTDGARCGYCRGEGRRWFPSEVSR